MAFKQIDTIVHAVKLFGTQTVCNLVTSTTLGQTIEMGCRLSS